MISNNLLLAISCLIGLSLIIVITLFFVFKKKRERKKHSDLASYSIVDGDNNQSDNSYNDIFSEESFLSKEDGNDNGYYENIGVEQENDNTFIVEHEITFIHTDEEISSDS